MKPETPSARAVRELREWLERHEHGGCVEFGGDIHGEERRPPETAETRTTIDEGLAANMARDAVRHVLSAIELSRHLAWGTDRTSTIFSPAEIVEVDGRLIRRPPSMRFSFGAPFDMPRELPDIGKEPQRWRYLAAVCHDFSTECFRGQAWRGEDHDARDEAADAIIALRHWPTTREIAEALAAARAPGDERARKAHQEAQAPKRSPRKAARS